MHRLFRLLVSSLGGTSLAAFTCNKIQTLSETQEGYYDTCLGLQARILEPCGQKANGEKVVMDQPVCAKTCREACAAEMACAGWMVTDAGCMLNTGAGCGFHGQAHIYSGQKIMHGGIKVLEQDTLLQCNGLIAEASVLMDGQDKKTWTDPLQAISHCRESCWTNPTCTVWTYNPTSGCNIGTSSAFCTRGEQEGYASQVIEHTCEAEDNSDLYVMCGVVGATVLALLIAVVVYNMWHPHGKSSKVRSVHGGFLPQAAFDPVNQSMQHALQQPMQSQLQAYNPVAGGSHHMPLQQYGPAAQTQIGPLNELGYPQARGYPQPISKGLL